MRISDWSSDVCSSDLQVWAAYQNLQTAHGNVDASRIQLEAAQRAADAIRARYKNGLSSILEVLSTEAALAQARVANVQSYLDWYLALATLAHDRSEERRVGKECVSTCRSRWSP